MGQNHFKLLSQQIASLNLILISFSLIQFINRIQPSHCFILPAVDNSSTLLNLTKINEKQLSFSELYPNLASLHQLLTSSIEYTSGQQYVQSSSPPASTESETDSSSSFSTTAQSSSETTDELLSKDKSIINIKFIKKLPRSLDIKKQRKKIDYLKDVNLNFDSAYLIEHWNNCTVKFKSYVKLKDTNENELFTHNNYELQKQNYSKQIHVMIEGSQCVQLPIRQLRPYANNITSLVVSSTGVERLEKYVFGAGALMKLEQLYLHANTKLNQLKSRAFDGLPFLSYLSIINNAKLSQLEADSFAGIKNLEELIYIGNGLNAWSYDYFSFMIKIVSSRILPNLVHFHLSHSACTLIDEDESEFELMRKYYTDFFIESNFTTPDRTKSSKVEIKKPNLGIKINKHDLQFIDQVKYLQLDDCELVYIHQDAFEPLLKNLVQLNLGYNSLINLSNLKQFLRQFFVTNNPNLTALKHSKKRFLKTQFAKEDQTELNELNYSNSSSNYHQQQSQFNPFVNSTISSTISTTSSKQFGLESLDLSGVLTTLQIPKDLFTVISKTTIKQLYLKNLFWRELQDLPPLPNLQTLNLDYSFLETIDENVFNTCENLVSLSLKGNLLSTIPLNMLEPLTKLERLDLSGYRSKEQDAQFYRKFTFCKKTFVYGTNLKDVNLNFKNLEILERKIFIGLFKLESLYLKQTNLKYVEYLTFFSLKSIVKIDLSNNPLLVYNIRLSEEDTFVGLEAIEEVNLSNCNITDQDLNDQNLFKRMKENMRQLDLSNNRISKVDAQTFLDFNELRSINLAFNQIKSWHTKIFTKQNYIQSLEISFNRLKEITPEMLADFRRLKRLAFSNNPLICDCLRMKGSILWLNNDNKQKKILNKLNNHEIQEHLESFVNRQQQIVTTVYAQTTDLLPPPKSILDWLEYSNAEFLNEQHPLRSPSYYCLIKDSDYLNELLDDHFNSSVSLGTFVNHYCLNSLFINGSLKFTMLIVIVTSLMLLTTFCLMIALVYNSTLRNIITMVDENIHHYEYDAFVSYNFNDSDWVLNKLVPSLEELPDSNLNAFAENHHQQQQQQQSSSSKIHFSSIYQENEQYNLRTWIRNNKNKKSTVKMNKKIDTSKNIHHSNEDSSHCCNQQQQSYQTNQQQQNRIKLCVYERDFIAGKQISDCITESIRNSRKVILVVSKNFAQSPWCRFETDLAHHTLVDQNRDGLILIKLEEDLSSEFLEKTAPQLHFLLKTRVYLSWTSNKKEQQIFWKKLHSALGFNKKNHIRNMYNYCTNHKPDLKRRHSVVLALTQNELNRDINNNVLDKINLNLDRNNLDKNGEKNKELEKIVVVKDDDAYKEKQVREACILTSSANEGKKNEFVKNEDQLDAQQLNNKSLHQTINNQLNSKLQKDQRINLRNLNQLISNSYGKT